MHTGMTSACMMFCLHKESGIFRKIGYDLSQSASQSVKTFTISEGPKLMLMRD